MHKLRPFLTIDLKCPFTMHTGTLLRFYIDGLVQDCSIPIANARETLHSCTKPSIWRKAINAMTTHGASAVML